MIEPHENTTELPQPSKSQVQNPGPALRTTTEWHCSLSLGLKDGRSGEVKPSFGDSGRRRTSARERHPEGTGSEVGLQAPTIPGAPGRPWGSRARLAAARSRPPGASLLTRTTIPRIQLGEHRSEINGAKAALHD